MRWYISAAAVRQYMALCGYPADDDGPGFDAAALELESLCEQAKLARDVGPGQQSQLWRVKATVRGKRTRLELVVSLTERPGADAAVVAPVRRLAAVAPHLTAAR